MNSERAQADDSAPGAHPARQENSAIEVRPGDPAQDDLRDRYVLAHPRGTFFHLAGWRRVIERVMRHTSRDLYAWRAGELVGILPIMECRGLLRGRAWISMPYAVYGGPIGADEDVVRTLYAEAEKRAIQAGVGRLELRNQHGTGLQLQRSELYVTFIRDLPEDPDQVLARMPKKSRAEARKARNKHGLELSAGLGHLDELLRLFHRNKRSLGSPALPATLFHALIEEFPEHIAVHLVHRDEEPLAAVMSFLFRDQLLAYYSGTADGADRAYSASNFMYLALQEWGVRQGYRIFDFGRSRKDAGAFKFKVNQGFEAADLHYEFLLVKDQHLPSLNPSNPKTKLLRDAWSRLPLWLAEKLSTPASRYLP